MSDSIYTNTNRAPSLANGDHDTGLYDPSLQDNRIVAVYETTEHAAVARDLLVKAGVPASDIDLVDQSHMTGITPAGDTGDHGIWASLKSLFVPDEDAYGYAEGVRRGHAVLSIKPTADTDRHHVIAVLEGTNPIDFDARLEEWRQAGYTYPNSSAIGAAAGMTTPSPAPSTYADTTPVAAADGKEAGDAPVKVVPPATPGTAGTGGKTTTATTGAESSGMNAPRK